LETVVLLQTMMKTGAGSPYFFASEFSQAANAFA